MFAYLQVLDLLTTLIGLHLGAEEASPFIRVMMHFGRPAAGVGPLPDRRPERDDGPGASARGQADEGLARGAEGFARSDEELGRGVALRTSIPVRR